MEIKYEKCHKYGNPDGNRDLALVERLRATNENLPRKVHKLQLHIVNEIPVLSHNFDEGHTLVFLSDFLQVLDERSDFGKVVQRSEGALARGLCGERGRRLRGRREEREEVLFVFTVFFECGGGGDVELLDEGEVFDDGLQKADGLVDAIELLRQQPHLDEDEGHI